MSHKVDTKQEYITDGGHLYTLFKDLFPQFTELINSYNWKPSVAKNAIVLTNGSAKQALLIFTYVNQTCWELKTASMLWTE